jgi:hypothetical protein
MKTLPIKEVRSLLSSVIEHGQQHLSEIEADLSQTTYLLSHAIDNLSSSFLSVHAAVVTQQKSLDLLLAKYDLTEAEFKEIEQYNNAIGDQVAAAITGLQFQDITSQLIARAIKRIEGLKTLLEDLHVDEEIDQVQSEHDAITHLLEGLNQSLHAGSQALTGGLRRSVDQKSMGAGEIDLF